MKSVNIIDEYTNYIKEVLVSIAKLILGKKYSEEIFSHLLDIYIKVRYYDSLERKSKKPYSNIKLYINEEVSKLKEEDKEKNAILGIYTEILSFEQDSLRVKEFINNIQKHLNFLKIDSNTFKEELNRIYSEINNKRKEIKRAFATKDFFCEYKSTNINKTYITYLDYSFSIPDLYSEAAVEKVYTTGKICEDKLYIEYYLVIYKLLTEVLNFDFSSNYIVEFVSSFFEKPGKFNKFLNIISNDLCKDKISLRITSSDFLKYKDEVLKYINDGYNFAIQIDDSYVDSLENNKLIASVFKYIIVSSNNENGAVFKDRSNLIKVK